GGRGAVGRRDATPVGAVALRGRLLALRLPDVRPLLGAARRRRHAVRDGRGPGAVVAGDGVAILARVALRLGPVLGVGVRQLVRDLALADGAGAVPPGAVAVATGHRSRRRGALVTARSGPVRQ